MRKILEHQRMFLAVLVLSLVFSLSFLPQIGIDNSVNIWFPAGDQAVEEYNEFQSIFGNDE